MTKTETKKISKKQAHVVFDQNQFVHELAKVADNVFVSDFIIDGKHAYLYENPEIANHVSGTTFFETSRQLMKATGHLFYDVPLDSRFLLKDLAIAFERWGQIGFPVTAKITVTPPQRSENYAGTYIFVLEYLQNGKRLGVFDVTASAMPGKVEDRLMARQFAQGKLLRVAQKVKNVFKKKEKREAKTYS
jgi:hypothetical protein